MDRNSPKPSHRRGSSLHEAAFNGDLEAVKSLLKNGRLINSKGPEHTTPIHEACFADQLEVCKYLIESGADVDATDKTGATPLHICSYNGKLKTVKLIVQSGANLNVRDKEGCFALHKAAYQGHYKCLKFLVKSGHPVDVVDEFGSTPLHHAAMQGHGDCVKYLISKAASVNCEDKDGATPLHGAAYAGRLEAVQCLVEGGASLDAQDKSGSTPLHHAAERGHTDIVKLLTDKGADVNIKDKASLTVLHNACFHGHYDCTVIICDRGANVNTEDKVTSPLHHAAYSGHTKCAALLLDRGAHADARDAEGATALHKACFNGHTDCTALLLDRGASVSIVDDEGSSPLHSAAFSGNHECLQLLIRAHAKVNLPDNDGSTPLHHAAYNGHIECLQTLVENEANVNAEDKSGTPLHLAVQRGNKTCVSFLIKNGANVNIQNKKGMTPLHHAVKYPPCVNRLLKSGAPVDVQDSSGRTPLFYAVKHNVEESVRLLIFKGADVNIKDHFGKAPKTASKVLTKKILLKIIKERSEYEEAQAHKEYKIAVKKFNTEKQQNGIQYLVESGIIQNTPEHIAKFLYTAQGLNKTKIGDYLGDPNNIQALQAFVNKMDFSNFEFDHALRYFLSKFRLPGEAQKIDRIMESFATRYHSDNPGQFSHPDTAYLLAFSTIMLNTDAHNPNIKKEKKMTVDEWIQNNKGINGGSDLSLHFLVKIYHRIVKEEIKMDTEVNSYTNAEKKGYLVKQGGKIRTWKRRFFVLKDNCLYYFRNHEANELIGYLPLENLAVRLADSKKKFAFEIYQPEKDAELKAVKFDSKGAIVKGRHDSYIISCASDTELGEWMKAIESNMVKNPFIELIKKKKSLQKQNGAQSPGSQRVDTRSRQNTNQGTEGRVKNLAELKVSFKQLHDLACMCEMVYKDHSVITQKYGPSTMVGSAGKYLVFFSTINNDTKKQYIVIGSKSWASEKHLKKDLQYWKPTATANNTLQSSPTGRESRNSSDSLKNNGTSKEPEDIYQFSELAKQVHATVHHYLKRDYGTWITGHSLYSATSFELAGLLHSDGFKISRIVTFGQPRFQSREMLTAFEGQFSTNVNNNTIIGNLSRTSSTASLVHLVSTNPSPSPMSASPLSSAIQRSSTIDRENDISLNHERLIPLRVIDLRDPVTCLFPKCFFPGTDVILLSDKYHTNVEGYEELYGLDPSSLEDDVLANHSIENYTKRIHQKLKDSILISFADRFKYK